MNFELSGIPPFKHLERLTTSLGIYEHALFHVPRPEHGYCVDDAARAIVVLCREPRLNEPAKKMLDLYLEFTLAAIAEDGSCHNRMNSDGLWMDEAGKGDWWGRASWGLGFAAVHAPDFKERSAALDGFRLLSKTLSPDRRAISFAALGAGEILLERPDEIQARKILMEAEARLCEQISPDWVWPEARLDYSNASIAEAVILAGHALHHELVAEHGIRMLTFLLNIEIHDGHFSPTPVGGRGPGESEVQFDQQPIEIAAIADACARAWAITSDPQWVVEIERAWGWFLGDNDVGVSMFDPHTGAGFDGLHARGPNQNQGAESTMAMLSTAQHFYKICAPTSAAGSSIQLN